MANNLVITDDEIEDSFRGTNFGGADHRKLLNTGVLKKAMDYHCGHTLTTIMQDMRLINADGKVLRRGKMLLREAYDYLVLNAG